MTFIKIGSPNFVSILMKCEDYISKLAWKKNLKNTVQEFRKLALVEKSSAMYT